MICSKQVWRFFRELNAAVRGKLPAVLAVAGFVLTVAALQIWWIVAANEAKPAGREVNMRAALRASSSLKFEARGSRTINLQAGQELQTVYVDEARDSTVDTARWLASGEATPLALTSDDFDEDGVADLVCAYRTPAGGLLVLHRGNVDSIYPNAPESKRRRAEGKFTDAPFLSPARVFQTAQAPELIVTGDFNADDNRDVIAARIGGSDLWFYEGTGHGAFAEASRVVLPGAVTALEVGEMNRSDGLADIVVGIAGSAGAKGLVFESPLGAINAQPEEFDLPAPATSLALGEIVGDSDQDLAIAAGNQLIVLAGRDRKLSFDGSNQPPVEQLRVSSRSFNFNIKSLVIGNFRADNQTDIAMLCDDGRVRISRNPALASSKRRNTLAGWRTSLSEHDSWPMASKLVRARVSSNPTDSLLVLDTENHRVNIIDQQPQVTSRKSGITTLAASAGGALISSLVSDSEPTAVLPMRLNSDALSSLVVLNGGRSSPGIVSPASPMTFTVNNSGDMSDAVPGNGICNDGFGNCTLRAAIQEANANPGADTINFAIGSGAVTIALSFVLPQITETLTLDGTTQPGFAGSPLIEIPGGGVSPGGDGFTIQAGSCVVRGFVINRFPGTPGDSGNGVSLNGSSSSIIEGNFLGTNANGIDALANEFGVSIAGGTGNTVGGTVGAARNLMSGNSKAGIIILAGTSANVIRGNFIGTDAAGNSAIPNTENGLLISGASNNTVGGLVPGARNIISGNTNRGVLFDTNASGNFVQGNFIGTNAAGTVALGNGSGTGPAGVPADGGVVLFASSTNTVGGTTAAAGNVISGNTEIGISLDNGSNNNTVQGNFAGTDVTGTSAIPNLEFGIMSRSSSNNLIGGTVAGARNVCSGNGSSGINLFTGIFPGASSNNTVQGNFVGVNAAGTAALPNSVSGFRINGGVNNTIGGTAAGAGNVVSGNGAGLVFLNSANGNTVQSNFIGTLANGTTPLPNTGDGINIATNSSNNTIGGTAASAANTIAFNGGRGISVVSGIGDGFLTNSIFSNASLGIDLNQDGVTPNDAGDADAGPNNLQNFPVLTSATPGAMTTIQGTLNSTPGTAFRVEFFSNSACDGSGNGEGTTFLGFGNVTTDGSGNATINVTLPVSVAAGSVVVATATDPSNNTSEFSACVTVAGACTITCPPNQTASTDPNQCGATVNYPPPTTSGACGTVTCIPATGSFFPTGVTNVNCTTAAGPDCSFTVTVNDTQAPTITCPPNQSINSSTPTPVNYPPPSVADNCPGATSNCAPASGSTFPVGTTTVTCTATDASSNTANCSFNVTVTPGCAVTCPGNQTASSSAAQCGATVNYPSPTIAGPCGTVSCSPASGNFFAVGTTTVTCTSSGGPTCSFTVTVMDDRPPVLTCPSNILKQTDPGKSTATIDYVPSTVTDNCPGATSVCLPPSGFTAPVGVTTVTCTGRDASNNTSSCSFTVTVVDLEPSTIRCPANVTAEIGPGQTSGVVTYPPPVVSDNLPGAIAACVPPSGAIFPLGVTTVVCTAKDSAGNQASCSFTVTVAGGTSTGRIIIPGGKPAIEFGTETPVPVKQKPQKKRGRLPCGSFSIQNSGFAPLRVTLAFINRVGADVAAGRISDPAEGEVFELSEVAADGGLTVIAVGSAVTIGVGAQKNFCLKFAPGIPGLAGITTGLRAPQAIPDVVNSRVGFSVAGGNALTLDVTARVETAVKLINPKNPRKQPFVTLSSSGDEFNVSFAVFDSNLDVSKAVFEFLDAAGNAIAGPFDVDLVQPIRDRNLVRGQSFSVEQRFTGARTNPRIKGVRVSVSDNESKAVISTTRSSNAKSSSTSREKGTTIILPLIRQEMP